MSNSLRNTAFKLVDLFKDLSFRLEKFGPNIAAPLYILFAGWCFFTMTIFNKLALNSINIAQIQIIRGIMNLFFAWVISKKENIPLFPANAQTNRQMIKRNILATQLAFIHFFLIK